MAAPIPSNFQNPTRRSRRADSPRNAAQRAFLRRPEPGRSDRAGPGGDADPDARPAPVQKIMTEAPTEAPTRIWPGLIPGRLSLGLRPRPPFSAFSFPPWRPFQPWFFWVWRGLLLGPTRPDPAANSIKTSRLPLDRSFSRRVSTAAIWLSLQQHISSFGGQADIVRAGVRRRLLTFKQAFSDHAGRRPCPRVLTGRSQSGARAPSWLSLPGSPPPQDGELPLGDPLRTKLLGIEIEGDL